MEPELKKVLRERGFPKPFLPQVENMEEYREKWRLGTARFVNSQLIRTALSECSPTIQQDLRIPVRDGTCLEARFYQPQYSKSSSRALIVLFHGGGFCLGGLDSEDALCRLFTSNLDTIVLNVGYRLAPEHPWPCGVQDSLDATIWAAKHATKLGACLKSGFVIGGVSGGATFAAIISHLWREFASLPQLTGAFLSIPILADDVEIGGVRSRLYVNEFSSIIENRDAPVLNEALSDRFWSIYLPDRSSPLFTPFLFKDHFDVPQTYIQACGLDRYRDGCLIYHKNLRSSSIHTKLDQYHGLPHGFWTVYPGLNASKKWLDDSIAGMRWLLEIKVKERDNFKL